ncbi:hypothetical protein FHR81_000453 [Actinoalloteichus hoggarensis]|uniref:Uncharacterized protein n=1 Tax=Actinoalloteichus hoggarensis TaxID=1470176 RepID=A0A221W2B9_9PSEU|nr:DUF4383 domain-containing protein [Actinoalloteichus hoggarensis]ASO19867.1 hypothetical protein AHOG_11120 [Actinoalloteichus hoggarensis]MBB5919424.1 hypothetical protein [Actinoalloteichus hoggarensis]
MVQSHGAHASVASPSMPAIQTTARIVGAVFLLLGILGFIPGITTDYGLMQFAGYESQAMLFGVFQVSILHNIIHILLGVIGLSMARSGVAAKSFLIGGGVVLLALALYGTIVGQTSTANIFPTNGADNWLHLLTGLGMILLGMLPAGADERTSEREHRGRTSAGDTAGGRAAPGNTPRGQAYGH